MDFLLKFYAATSWNSIIHQTDITPEQFVVLVKLSEENGISQMELANRLDKDKNNVKAMVDNLSKKGYLIKKRIKPIKELILYILQKKPKLLFLK